MIVEIALIPQLPVQRTKWWALWSHHACNAVINLDTVRVCSAFANCITAWQSAAGDCISDERTPSPGVRSSQPVRMPVKISCVRLPVTNPAKCRTSFLHLCESHLIIEFHFEHTASSRNLEILVRRARGSTVWTSCKTQRASTCAVNGSTRVPPGVSNRPHGECVEFTIHWIIDGRLGYRNRSAIIVAIRAFATITTDNRLSH